MRPLWLRNRGRHWLRSRGFPASAALVVLQPFFFQAAFDEVGVVGPNPARPRAAADHAFGVLEVGELGPGRVALLEELFRDALMVGAGRAVRVPVHPGLLL